MRPITLTEVATLKRSAAMQDNDEAPITIPKIVAVRALALLERELLDRQPDPSA